MSSALSVGHVGHVGHGLGEVGALSLPNPPHPGLVKKRSLTALSQRLTVHLMLPTRPLRASSS